MFESKASRGADYLDQLRGGKVIGLWGPTAVSSGAAVETAFVTLIGERNAEVIYLSAERIEKGGEHGIRLGCGW
jgi:hypothetical protein